MTLISLTTTQIAAFRIAFEAIDALISDVMLVFTKDDIRIKDLDKTGKLLISAIFDTDKFDNYIYDHTSEKYKVGVSVESITKALKSNLSYDTMVMNINGTNGGIVDLSMTLISNSRGENKYCVIKTADVITSPDNISNMGYKCKFTINPTILSKYIKDLNHVCESVTFELNNASLILKGTINDKNDDKLVTSYNLKNGNVITINKVPNDNPSKKVSMNSLLLLNRCINLSPECSFYMSNDLPLLVSFPISSLGEIKILYL